jgi:hypothetical protein
MVSLPIEYIDKTVTAFGGGSGSGIVDSNCIVDIVY